MSAMASLYASSACAASCALILARLYRAADGCNSSDDLYFQRLSGLPSARYPGEREGDGGGDEDLNVEDGLYGLLVRGVRGELARGELVRGELTRECDEREKEGDARSAGTVPPPSADDETTLSDELRQDEAARAARSAFSARWRRAECCARAAA